MADRKKHFCTCGDLECPCNPNNPSNLAKETFGCDACIRKNLALGEVPTCMFVKLGDTAGWHDWSVEGFAEFVRLHPRSSEVRAATAAKAAAFEAGHKGTGANE